MASIYRKYRPQRFGNVCGQSHVVKTIQNQISGSSVAHAYLFSGPRGIGKTTMARLLAQAVNCSARKETESESCGACDGCVQFSEGRAMHIIEIDAASHTGVDHVREHIIDASRVSPGAGKKKVFIIDEVHMLSTSAFNALLKTLEEPPAHALFILATTELHKIPATILSRCQRFDFHRISSDEIVKRLKTILKKEGVEVEEEVLITISTLSEGCLRDAESLLEQILALGEKKITAKEASLVLPHTDTKLVSDLCDQLAKNLPKEALQILNTFVDQGGSVKHLIDEMIPYVRSVLFAALGDQANPRYGKDVISKIEGLADILTPDRASKLLDILIDVRSRRAPEAFPQLPLEIAIVEFCNVQSPALNIDDNGDGDDDTPASPDPCLTGRQASETGGETPAAISPSHGRQEEPAIMSSDSSVTFSLEEIQDKWGRCCQEVGKQNIAVPLVLQRAKPSAIEKGVVFVSFDQAFHFETMSAHKNIAILEKAIEIVMQCKVKVEPILEVSKDEKVLGDLVSAFGGTVVE